MYQRKLKFQPPEKKAGSDKVRLIAAVSVTALAIILIYLYISSGSDNDNPVNIEKISRHVTKEIISKDIDSVLFSFGIKREWIKEVPLKESIPGRENMISKEIKIPSDLLTIELNYELTNYFKSVNLKDRAAEDPKTKNLVISIYTPGDSADKLTGKLNFIYTDSVRRNASEVCIILDSLDFYPLGDVQKILSSPENFSLFLPMRNDKADYQSDIQESGKDYVIDFIIGDENDVAADFKSDMSEKIWKSKVKTVSVSYAGTSGIILTDRKDLKEFTNLIREEFTKNEMKVFSDSFFTPLKTNDQKINSLFENIVSNSVPGKRIQIYAVNMSPEEFKEYESKVYSLKKLGYKFIRFSEAMKRLSAEQ